MLLEASTENNEITQAHLTAVVSIASQSLLTGWIADSADHFRDSVKVKNEGSDRLGQLLHWLMNEPPTIADLQWITAEALPALRKSEWAPYKDDQTLGHTMTDFLQRLLIISAQSTASFPRVTPISSSLIESFYDENPYPIWSNAGTYGMGVYNSYDQYLKEYLPRSQHGLLNVLVKQERILLAGCGSGHQMALALAQYKNSHVTGMDLSKTNLQYAHWRMRELFPTSSRWSLCQGDLTQVTAETALCASGQFDVIECCGVLHHCDDPTTALKALVSALRPGGILLLGVYSAVGTERVRECIRWIHQKFNMHDAYHPTLSDIRKIRDEIEKLPTSSTVKQVLCGQLSFYSTSAFRDMLFHPCAHYFSLSELKELVDMCGLGVLSFSFDSIQDDIRTRLEYSSLSSSDCEMCSWDVWKKVERRGGIRQSLPWHNILLQKPKE
ncbi:hypothetical protein DIPPA_60681 [Diplonema papillatum]|nr:hypothetical protein DIPPA_60681 [Diplonema papillatum]